MATNTKMLVLHVVTTKCLIIYDTIRANFHTHTHTHTHTNRQIERQKERETDILWASS